MSYKTVFIKEKIGLKQLCSTIFFFKMLLLLLWLQRVFIAAGGLSLGAESGDYSLLWCWGFSLLWLLLNGTQVLGEWSPYSGTQAWLPPARNRTHVPCIGRQILYH